jgi:hypothetical protein
MNTHTIDTSMAKRMVEASAIRGASIIGQPGGWSVVLKMGLQERPLGAQRSDKPRTWRSLDRAVAYLKNELHIARFDLLDATNHSEGEPLEGKSRGDASERLRLAHEAAGHDNARMNESRPALTLINSDYNARLEADVAHMLEDIPAEDAMQQLRVLRRRIQPAANSLIATVAPATSE